MQWIFQFILRHRSITSLCLTVTLSIWLLQQDLSRQERIGRMLMLTVFYPFNLAISTFTHARNIFAENKQLRQQLTDLTIRLAQLQEYEAENQRFRELLGYNDSLSYKLIAVRVVARDPSVVYRSIVINAGKNKNVEKFSPVVTKDGIVGKIVQVMPTSSLVQVLRDPSHRVSVFNRRNRLVGILKTENGLDFFVQYRIDSDIVVGDEIVTSGLGGIYPKGLSVGKIDRIENSRDPLFKNAYIKLSVDFDRLEEAFVVQLSPQWASFRNELDSLGFKQ